MSEEELKKFIEQNLNPENPNISTEAGLAVARSITVIADAEKVEWALAGGLAMQLYGFERATKDVDFVAARTLSLQIKNPLSFGGARYIIETGQISVPVDWIVRRDKWQNFYREALADASVLPNGLRVLTPEWLVILKYIAGRAKDELDILYLLQQKGLVSRRKLKRDLLKAADSLLADTIFRELERRYMTLADSAWANGDENETYRPPEFDDYPEYNE